LPYSFIFLHATKLLDRDIIPNNAMEIVTDEIYDHEILRDFLFTASQQLFCDFPSNTRGLADGAFDWA
jgi:hypothetical protein